MDPLINKTIIFPEQLNHIIMSNQSSQITKSSHYLPANPQTGKALKLTLEINPDVPGQVEEFEAVAVTKPNSLQDFLIRLNELQKQKHANKIIN